MKMFSPHPLPEAAIDCAPLRSAKTNWHPTELVHAAKVLQNGIIGIFICLPDGYQATYR